jgi:predicted ATP-dependent endonuclease of OLD family
MKYTKFTIKKFKGIDDLTIDLEKYPNGKIFPLVGLNESGKTTILEAINFFQENLEDGNEYKIIHKKDSGGFTGTVKIVSELVFSKSEIKNIEAEIKKTGYELENTIEKVNITKYYSFENNVFKESKDVKK